MIDDISETEQYIYDLRCEIKRINATIGNMFEKGHITGDMIAEALDDKTDPEDFATLSPIYHSWGGNKLYASEALKQFSLILKTIRSYE